jgi:hypothetical protein
VGAEITPEETVLSGIERGEGRLVVRLGCERRGEKSGRESAREGRLNARPYGSGPCAVGFPGEKGEKG